ncbi:MAG TPA: Uma2 family endonuclease [Pirellulales bacterium]|nr:Uma2 family endonuclease [Pirellulales bacterium]
MSTHLHISPTADGPFPFVPPLESGDCLSRDEFERRYEAMPELKKAELIEGVVYVGAPVSFAHGEADTKLSLVFATYAAQTPGVQCAGNSSVLLDLRNEFQPDILLRIANSGRSTLTSGEKPFLQGAPELVAEVALTSAGRDLHSKLEVYRRQGVHEYIVWRVLERAIDWFCLEQGQYIRQQPDDRGLLRSREFPGLWLDGAALLEGRMTSVLERLQQGIDSPEHAAFVERLAH